MVFHLGSEERFQIERLLKRFSDCFARDSADLGSCEMVHHVINTGDHDILYIINRIRVHGKSEK